MLTNSTHSAISDSAATDPAFGLDTDVAACAVVPETGNEMWWAAKIESEQFISQVDFTPTRQYMGKISSALNVLTSISALRPSTSNHKTHI